MVETRYSRMSSVSRAASASRKARLFARKVWFCLQDEVVEAF
jgi:hypothetical protein